jgi:CDP-glucose 4,6-dehydratase
LKLDCTKANQVLGWQPRWSLDKAIQNIADWYRAFSMEKDMQLFSLEQIREYQQNKIN